jgi:hypothetical protein
MQVKISRKDNVFLVFSLLFLGFLSVYLRIFFTQDADIGIFISISSLVARGYTLYSEAFEIKDPYFFYSNGLFLKMFGLRGPFFLDSLYLLLVPFFTYFISFKFRLSNLQSYMVTLLFIFTLTGIYYQPLRTQTPAIIAFLAALLSLQYHKYFLCGIFCSIIVFSKLPLAILILSLVPFIFFLNSRSKLRSFKEVTFGFIAFTLFFSVIMQVRGEFFPYISMIRENFLYAGSFTSLVGMPTGIYGHIKLWNDSNGGVFVFFALLIFVFLLVIKRRHSRQFDTYLVCFTVLLCIGFFLIMTMLWWHHLEVLSLVVLFGLIAICGFINEGSESLRGRVYVATSLMGLLLILLNAGAAGVSFQPKPSMKLATWVNPSWTIPIEISALESVAFNEPNQYRFARLGINDELGFIAFLPDKWKFECSRLGILGWESKSTLDQHLKCLSAKPNVILISDMHYRINLTSGYFPEFKEGVDRMLNNEFNCRFLWDTKFKVCVKKDTTFTQG